MQESDLELVLPSGNIFEAIGSVLDRLRKKVERLYLHVDLDVLDVGDALPNHLAVPGGLTVEAVEAIIQMVKTRFEIAAGAITSFDPEYDKGDKVPDPGIRIVQAFVTQN